MKNTYELTTKLVLFSNKSVTKIAEMAENKSKYLSIFAEDFEKLQMVNGVSDMDEIISKTLNESDIDVVTLISRDIKRWVRKKNLKIKTVIRDAETEEQKSRYKTLLNHLKHISGIWFERLNYHKERLLTSNEDEESISLLNATMIEVEKSEDSETNENIGSDQSINSDSMDTTEIHVENENNSNETFAESITQILLPILKKIDEGYEKIFEGLRSATKLEEKGRKTILETIQKSNDNHEWVSMDDQNHIDLVIQPITQAVTHILDRNVAYNDKLVRVEDNLKFLKSRDKPLNERLDRIEKPTDRTVIKSKWFHKQNRKDIRNTNNNTRGKTNESTRGTQTRKNESRESSTTI